MTNKIATPRVYLKAKRRRDALRPMVVELREEGLSFRAIADEMQRRRVPAPGGSAWYRTTVARLLKKA